MVTFDDVIMYQFRYRIPFCQGQADDINGLNTNTMDTYTNTRQPTSVSGMHNGGSGLHIQFNTFMQWNCKTFCLKHTTFALVLFT